MPVFPKYDGMRIGIRRIAAEDKDWLVFDCFNNIRQDMGAKIRQDMGAEILKRQ